MMKNKYIKKEDGYGGQATRRLIEEIIIPVVDNPAADRMDDSALLKVKTRDILFSTDGYVVKPLFFPGGDIGQLAVSGTINDIIAQGGEAKFISAGVIVEEGFLIDNFKKIIESAAAEARSAGVEIVCGDIKVVEPGAADGIFITTAGIGERINGLFRDGISPRDEVIVTGAVAEHGAAIFQARNDILEGTLEGTAVIKSDVAALNGLYGTMEKYSADIKFMRDPTRGGLAEVAMELAEMAGMSVELSQKAIPVKDWVKGLAYITGIDYLYLACEGRMVIICGAGKAEGIVKSFKADGFSDAARIGEIKTGNGASLKTAAGGARYLTSGEIAQIPRIC
jgi:hydrogenase expression/formation protein HypE